ncbi:hypothetical protein SAMN02745220_05085 [Desulfopila aestuarii DSM 18488]|uniref:Uncharacterized protein n=1 Tax=Desulfopila aestuarii DSM 18488 TaxID=1121416 RepID=A0A1M7YL67_9BACT|nr:hypothetical protein SAMN02745220_05085 [Desulfopila aestuarii DSM 18488]
MHSSGQDQRPFVIMMPVVSSTISIREMYLKTGFKVAQRTLERIKGLTAAYLASGRCSTILNDIAQTGKEIDSAPPKDDHGVTA